MTTHHKELTVKRTRTTIAATGLAIAGLIAAAQPAQATSHYTRISSGDGPGQHVVWDMATGFQTDTVSVGYAYPHAIEWIAKGNDYVLFWRFYNAAGTVRCAFGSYEHPERHTNLQYSSGPGHTCGYSDVRRVRIGVDVGYDGDGWREVSVYEAP